jgi:hypothetical protein
MYILTFLSVCHPLCHLRSPIRQNLHRRHLDPPGHRSGPRRLFDSQQRVQSKIVWESRELEKKAVEDNLFCKREHEAKGFFGFRSYPFGLYVLDFVVT